MAVTQGLSAPGGVYLLQQAEHQQLLTLVHSHALHLAAGQDTSCHSGLCLPQTLFPSAAPCPSCSHTACCVAAGQYFMQQLPQLGYWDAPDAFRMILPAWPAIL